MSENIKDILKPPFVSIGSGVVDREGNTVVFDTGGTDIERCMRADWIATAMNQKADREWSKLHWEKVPDDEAYADYDYICPQCKEKVYFYEGEMTDFDFCPHCGVRLLPPEEK